MFYRYLSQVIRVAICLAAASALAVAQSVVGNEPQLTEEQESDFLLHAKVVDKHQLGVGITRPWRLTLSDGKLTHDAAFQSIDDMKGVMQLANGRAEPRLCAVPEFRRYTLAS